MRFWIFRHSARNHGALNPHLVQVYTLPCCLQLVHLPTSAPHWGQGNFT